MKPTLLLTALLCGSAQASDITIDIWRPPDLNEYGNPNPGGIPTVFVGSYTMPGSPFSPELNFHGDTLDWRPFGLSYFKADIHGTFCVATPGTGRLMMQGGVGGIASGGAFSIDNNPASFLLVGSIDGRYQDTFTLAQGVHSFDLIYTPGQKQTDVANNLVQILPDGKDGIAIIDEDHAWFPDKLGVPESDGWLLWLVPAGILLLRRKQ